MKHTKNILLGLLLVVAFGVGVWWVAKPKSVGNANAAANTNGVAFVDQCTTAVAASTNVNGTQTIPQIRYDGSDGKNALELLDASHEVDASDAGYVNRIDGIAPGDHQFWLLCVNGAGAEVGAKDLATRNGDTIEWRLGTF